MGGRESDPSSTKKQLFLLLSLPGRKRGKLKRLKKRTAGNTVSWSAREPRGGLERESSRFIIVIIDFPCSPHSSDLLQRERGYLPQDGRGGPRTPSSCGSVPLSLHNQKEEAEEQASITRTKETQQPPPPATQASRLRLSPPSRCHLSLLVLTKSRKRDAIVRRTTVRKGALASDDEHCWTFAWT